MAADAPRTAGGAAADGKGHVDVAVPDAAQLHLGRYAINKARMVPLAEYSRDCLRALREQTGITYDERSQGTLQLFRTQSQVDGTGGDIEVLKQFGVPFELLDPAGCIEAEPALARVREKIKGGLRLPGDETGDCKLFTERLAAICRERGVTFRFGVETGTLSRNSSDDEVAAYPKLAARRSRRTPM